MTDSPSAPGSARRTPALLQGAGLAIAIAAVFHGALGTFFSQDDFAGLARAQGLVPRLEGPWRYLSGQAYFDAMRVVAGLDPRLYHLASLLAHLACAVLLLAFLGRRTGPWAAWIGAVFCAVHPASFRALYSVSGIGEILALAFGLATLLAARSAGRGRWAAPPLFALSLLSKESTLLLPLVLLADRYATAPARAADPRAATRRADPVTLALGALSLAYLLTFLAGDTFGIRARLPESQAYALAFDRTLGSNLLTYAGWTVNFVLPLIRSVSDSIDPAVAPWGVIGMILWIAGLRSRGLRERGWILGGVMYLAFLLPVLPLRNHTYHYYLYAPLAGAAACVAAAADWLLARRPATATGRRAGGDRGRGTKGTPAPSRLPAAARPGLVPSVAILAALLLTGNAALVIRKIETHPFVHPALRSDPTIDRARIAAQVRAGLAAAALPPRSRLHFWSPASIELDRAAGRDTSRESYWERNVREALLDGLAVRVLFPQVREVRFVRAFLPDDMSDLYAVYLLDGNVRVVSAGTLDSLRRSAGPP